MEQQLYLLYYPICCIALVFKHAYFDEPAAFILQGCYKFGKYVASQHYHNTRITLWQCCFNILKIRDFIIATILWQHFVKVMWMLWADQSTAVPQHRTHVAELCNFQSCYNVEGTHQESIILFPISKIKLKSKISTQYN